MIFRKGVWWLRVEGDGQLLYFILCDGGCGKWWVMTGLWGMEVMEVMVELGEQLFFFIFWNCRSGQAMMVVKEEWHPVSTLGHDLIPSAQ